MSQFLKTNKYSTRKSAKTVDEAIIEALNELGVTKDDVTVDIIEEGKNGFLGFGKKDAVVNVTIKDSVIEAAKSAASKPSTPKAAPVKPSFETKEEKKFTPAVPQEKKAPAVSQTEIKENAPAPITELKGESRSAAKPKKEAAPAPIKPVKQYKLPPEQRSAAPKAADDASPERPARPERFERRPRRERTRKDRPRKAERPAAPKPEERPATPKKISGIPPEEIATKFLSDLLNAMQLDVKITAEMQSEDTLLVNLDGENMGIVIGKRGDTLDSLQYLTSLVINQQTENYIKVTIDTENYREKRTEALLVLSNRLADKVTKTGKKFTLEPMSPYERRIIHANLQDSETVTTFSVGTEPFRKVVIAPKNVRRSFKKKPNRPVRPARKPRKPYRAHTAVQTTESENTHQPSTTAEKKGSYTTTYKADFKPQQHKAEYKTFDDYLKAQENND